ncbi:MAG: DUF1330 domain-containing protein [Alphaproteobacteria bacterium]|nr:DUF1330 domain-containing protein [Alphaproteobacteria bacterium]
MPAYMISQVTVTDQEKFQSYLAQTLPIGAKFGAKPIVLGVQPKTLTGESDGHQMVFVIEFPTMERLEAWHHSDEYKAIVPLREEGSHQHMVAYEAKALPQR